jgi:hypothetical protein
MTRNVGNFVENQFVKGLITEATGFNFPENAVIESDNCRYKKTGEVTRRLGYSYENGSTLTSQTVYTGVHKSFMWKDVGSDGGISFLVYQNGHILYFYQKDENGYCSNKRKSFTVNLRNYKSGKQNRRVENKEAAFAFGDGKLFVAHPYCDPIYIKYSASTDDITVTRITVKIRDVFGLDDGLAATKRPTTLSFQHYYNLINQGWGNSVRTDKKENKLPIGAIFHRWDVYPSNADIWWLLRGADGYFDDRALFENSMGNTEAPKGYLILDAFNQDRTKAVNTQTNSTIGHLAVTTSNGHRPSCVAFFAGRLWLAGVASEDFFNTVYYSQIMVNDSDIGKCYQKNDPTNENLSDLLDTDGGTINIVGVGKIVSLYSTGNSLIVFATNGIWAIGGSGANGTGFIATDFSVAKISSIGISQATSILDVDGLPIWWNSDGLWAIQKGQVGDYAVVSLTNDTIKTFMEENIPVANRSYIQAAYNPLEHTIQWLYKSTESTTVPSYYSYNRVLELNLQTGAFYPFSFSGKTFRTIYCSFGAITTSQSTSVDSDAGTSITVSGNALTFTEEYEAPFVSAKYKYITTNVPAGTGIAFIEEGNDTDWKDFNSSYFSSSFTTGAKVHAEGNKNFTSEYITVLTKDVTGNGTTDQGAYLSGRWDWTNDTSSKKWSTNQQLYGNRGYRDVQRRRLIIRGSGPALQLRVSSINGKGFTIVGWSAFESADATP